VAASHIAAAAAEARVARQELGLGLDQPVHDILRVIEETQRLPVSVLRLGEGVAGAYIVRRSRPFIFLNGAQPVTRQRFTLAHELGHHRLGHAAVVDGVSQVEGKSDEPIEQQANAFAGEFLAPDQALHGWMSAHGDPLITIPVLVRLASWFGVSAPAALVRLSQAGILRNARQKRDLQALIQRGAHRGAERALDLEAVDDSLARISREGGLPRVPTAMRDNALTAYAAGLIDLDRLAGALRQDRASAERLVGELGLVPVAAEPDW
jgi:Zn-dependent peptidase ImmA (M78 family)